MSRLCRCLLAAAILSLLASVSHVHAQDSFGGNRSSPPAQQSQYRQQSVQQQNPQQQMPQGDSGEAQDYGVAPTQQLRPSSQLGGPTPTSIPGGRVVGTQQLAQMLRGGQSNLLLLHAYGGMQHLPGAIPVARAAQGGSFDDQVQRDFGQYLQQITNGDPSRALVFYCGGTQCWGSYNAALRAIRMGYRNVAWYRGGVEAWQQAGLPVLVAGGPQGQPQPTPSQQTSSAQQW